MKKSLLLIFAMALFSAPSAFGWGGRGHDVVAYIAECHLTKKAKQNIAKYLEHPIIYYSSTLDWSHQIAGYGHTRAWHGTYVDGNLRNAPHLATEAGKVDAVQEMNRMIGELRDHRNLDDSTRRDNLKAIIHLMGDIHCPGHIIHSGVPRSFEISLRGEKMSFHYMWDTGMMAQRHSWSYTEYRNMLDICSKEEIAAISAGTLEDWVHETAVDFLFVNDLARAGSDHFYGDEFVEKTTPILENQLLKAGYRLAKVLNDLFGK